MNPPRAAALRSANLLPAPRGLPFSFHLAEQPTETTCGPTCLHAVYAHFSDPIPLARIVREIPQLEYGGTLAVMLGCHALGRGYRALLHTWDLRVFDPTWFERPTTENLIERLRHFAKYHRSGRRATAARAYIEFLELGGRLAFEDLDATLLRRLLQSHAPLIAGVSATALYRAPREDPRSNRDDDVRGEPVGHFVVLCGYRTATHAIEVADPYRGNPGTGSQYYLVSMRRLINALLLGVLTADANLLCLAPAREAVKELQ